MEHVACNQCGGTDMVRAYEQPDTLFDTADWFSIVGCARCGLGFVNPRPTPAEMTRYYPPQFFSEFEDSGAHQNRYAAQAALLAVTAAKANGTLPLLLDIGCANGDFPRFMRDRGWRVEGLEVSPNANAIDDFPVHRMPLPELAFDAPRYDAITAWAVLEHVHDPRAYFAKAAALLKPGGQFAFLVTNFESLSSRALFNEDIPRHLYFFTEKSLRAYLADAGLNIQTIRYDNAIFEMTPVNILYYLWAMLRGRALRWQDTPESRHLYIQRKRLKRGMGATLRYALTHPLAAIDRCAAMLYGRWQMRNNSYGIITMVATKPKS
jgi:SAM-dependent methyltransferase